MFKLSGIWQGLPSSVEWDDGKLISSPPLLGKLIEDRASLNDLVALRLGGPYLDASLANPASALLLIRERFDKITSEEGDLPDLQELLADPTLP
jgi:hypothetical protein